MRVLCDFSNFVDGMPYAYFGSLSGNNIGNLIKSRKDIEY